MGTWLAGWGLGLSVAAPIGPINVAALQIGLARGFGPAAAFGLGAATTDAAYCLAVYFGLAPLLVAAPWLRIILYLGGAYLIARLAWSALSKRMELRSGSARQAAGLGRLYASGVALTSVNPATIVSWLAIGGAALSSVPADEGLALVIGIFCGSALWFTALAVAAGTGRHIASDRVLRIVSVACAIALSAYAAVFAWKGVTEAAALLGLGA